ncbi:MAG: polyketide synthase dehydratase domain-containing protein, partial [Candidatus Binatus sp.]
GGIPSQLPSYDIDSVRGRCNSGTLGFESPARNEAQERHIAFGSRWRNLKTVWLGRDEALSQLELPEEFAAEVDTYRLHPALLDMATGSAMLLIKGNEENGYLYVPISYGNVTISGPLQASCYAYVRSKAGASIESPIATFDVSIMDGNGKTIVEVRDFSVRQIRDLALLEGSNTVPVKELENSQDLEVAEAAASSKLPDAISSEEGREAFERIIANQRNSGVVVFPSNFDAYMDRTKPRHLLVASERSIADSNDSSDEEVEETLTRWWKELLGVGAVSLQDNFFDLGGQSLTGVRLLSKIKKKYGVDLKLSALFAAPTIEKLCALIPNQTAQPSVLSRMRALSSTPGPRGKSHSGSLIEIRRGGPRNLFLVHDGGGDMPYLNLARRMPEDVGVFGIEPRRIAGVPLAHVSIEDMASFYVEEIRRKQPHGPYLLGGICAGGVIAYEMASQLIRAGETVELVAMLDAALAGIQERRGLHTKQQLDRFKTTFADSKKSEVGLLNRARVLTGAVKELVNFLLSEVARRGARLSVRARFRLLRVLLSRDLAWPRFVPELSVLEIYESAAARYTPSPLSISSVVLARAKTGEGLDKPYKEIYADETLGWNGIARGLVIVDVDGGHFTMLQERFVASLWEALMPYLQREAKQSANAVRSRVEPPVALPAMTSESLL